MKPYLAYSTASHLLLAAALFGLAARNGLSRPKDVYRIDFIGSTPGIMNRDKESAPGAPAAVVPAAPASAAKPPPQSNPDNFNLRKPSLRPLPRPSFLSNAPKPSLAPTPAAAPAPAAQAKPAAGTPGGAGGDAGAAPGSGSASISADMPDFPYPWYLNRLRATLWDRWSSRMPSGAGECTVTFTVMRDGTAVDLRVTSTSGDAAFDYAALSSVQDSAPHPPLPPDFGENFLKIHVQFKR